MQAIKISWNSELELNADLSDTATARAIADALPIETRISTWGDEHYFGIPVQADAEPGASAAVELGDLAYWPPGNAFCVFFGPTPASHGPDDIRAASPVNVVGRLRSTPVEELQAIRSGSTVRIEALDE
ncbi:MAG: cyclophilin-like fold protein [Chloroflexi bacterium]|nr:cyclophilin-like fold protein [Chloroflexota bacterium]